MERRKEKGEEGVRMPSMGINGLPFKLGPGRGGGGVALSEEPPLEIEVTREQRERER